MKKPGNLSYERSFSRVRKETPKDTSSINHELLVKGGYIHQETAGVFTLLPLGKRVVQHIEDILRDEMNGLGAQEVSMPALHPKENWVFSGRWDMVDVLFKVKSRWGGREYALGPTHEEIVTPLAKNRIHSYRDLPLAIYQIQTKFRDEKRAKSGIIRGREFGMKDMYSFHSSEEDLHMTPPAYSKPVS
jgi:prolyl-tRNA synthetase